jgi:predicted AlkP superfamily pyrophosphatase or phosphodiesterase
MKRAALFLLSVLSALHVNAKGPARPKLVVGIVVDQMRWDYLYRFYGDYGPDGFRRLMNGGFRCEQAKINYLPSYTAPGHTCVYTGSVPAIHGIAANEWIENGKPVYCTDDDTAKPVGGSWRWGKMSPRNLQTTTVTDELRMATNFRSRVFAVSLKDRSSILPGGHLANEAYWFDDSTGNFASSSYYMSTLPEWVRRFNAKRYADSILARDWELLNDTSTYTQSSMPNSRYEGLYDKSETRIGFSHRAGFFLGKGDTKYNAVRKLPAGNWMSLLFAKQCISSNHLGAGTDPDFLAVSLSSTDYIGHQFGPNSREIEDTYRRLDRELAGFMSYLDEMVGEGNYTVFLTADHGAAQNSIYLSDKKVPAGNISESTLRKDLNAFLKSATGKDSMVRSLENYQVWLDESRVPQSFTDQIGLRQLAIQWLRKRPEIAFAIDLPMSAWNATPEPIHQMSVNGYYASRCGQIQIILKPGYYSGYSPTGTTHGTWNPYDTHIPLLWYGWGIRKGELNREVHMTDIAATVAALLKIQMPNGCIGKVVTEALK